MPGSGVSTFKLHEDWTFPVECEDANGAPLAVTAAKMRIGSGTTTILEVDGTIDPVTVGLVTFLVPRTQQTAFTGGSFYAVEVQVTQPSGAVATIYSGRLNVLASLFPG